MNSSSRNYDFRHFTASIVEVVRGWRFSLMIFLVAEKSRFTSKNMTEIDRKSITIRNRVGNRGSLCCISSLFKGCRRPNISNSLIDVLVILISNYFIVIVR